jgi:chromosome segregation ATPase
LEDKRYKHAGPSAHDKLNDVLRRSEQECAAAQKERDSALRELRRNATSVNVAQGGARLDSEGASGRLDTIETDVKRLMAWIDEAGPALEALKAERNSFDEEPISSKVLGKRVDRNESNDSSLELTERVNAMANRIDSLEDHQDELRVQAEDCFSLVKEYIPPGEGVNDPYLTAFEAELAIMHGQMDQIRAEIVDIAEVKYATALDVQRLRAEQEQMKLMAMEACTRSPSVMGPIDADYILCLFLFCS